MSNNAVETLLKERDRLKTERDNAVYRFAQQIEELEAAIERLSGKTVWQAEQEVKYDDEHPDYIKSSIED